MGPCSRTAERQALRVRPRRPGQADASHLLRAVQAKQPPGAAAHLGARGRCEHPDRAEPATLGADDREVQGALGRPGPRERRPADQRHERDQRGHGADHEARDRDVRLRHRLRRGEQRGDASPGVLRASVPERGRPLHPGRHAADGHGLGRAQVAGGGTRSDGELPELRVVHRRGVGEPRRLRAGGGGTGASRVRRPLDQLRARRAGRSACA